MIRFTNLQTFFTFIKVLFIFLIVHSMIGLIESVHLVGLLENTYNSQDKKILR